MNEEQPNQGMRCIRDILTQYGSAHNLHLVWDEFEVRVKKQVPDLSYDLYISSGGPGSPLDTTAPTRIGTPMSRAARLITSFASSLR